MYEKGKPEVLVNQSKGLAIAEKLDLVQNFECLYYMLFVESKHNYFSPLWPESQGGVT